MTTKDSSSHSNSFPTSVKPRSIRYFAQKAASRSVSVSQAAVTRTSGNPRKASMYTSEMYPQPTIAHWSHCRSPLRLVSCAGSLMDTCSNPIVEFGARPPSKIVRHRRGTKALRVGHPAHGAQHRRIFLAPAEPQRPIVQTCRPEKRHPRQGHQHDAASLCPEIFQGIDTFGDRSVSRNVVNLPGGNRRTRHAQQGVHQVVHVDQWNGALPSPNRKCDAAGDDADGGGEMGSSLRPVDGPGTHDRHGHARGAQVAPHDFFHFAFRASVVIADAWFGLERRIFIHDRSGLHAAEVVNRHRANVKEPLDPSRTSAFEQAFCASDRRPTRLLPGSSHCLSEVKNDFCAADGCLQGFLVLEIALADLQPIPHIAKHLKIAGRPHQCLHGSPYGDQAAQQTPPDKPCGSGYQHSAALQVRVVKFARCQRRSSSCHRAFRHRRVSASTYNAILDQGWLPVSKSHPAAALRGVQPDTIAHVDPQ